MRGWGGDAAGGLPAEAAEGAWSAHLLAEGVWAGPAPKGPAHPSPQAGGEKRRVISGVFEQGKPKFPPEPHHSRAVQPGIK